MGRAADIIQDAKRVALEHTDALDAALAAWPVDAGPAEAAASEAALVAALALTTTADYNWRGSHPFCEQPSAAAAVSSFWAPLCRAMRPLQRREDIFLAGYNDVEGKEHELWVCSMGHFAGLFDRPWLGIPPTGRLSYLRYVEFHRVDTARGLIAESCVHCDVIAFMIQAGHNPLPPAMGAHITPHPGPATHAGRLLHPQLPASGVATLALCNQMSADLSELNEKASQAPVAGADEVPVELLARTWHDDMVWYGPGGIGATYTIGRYIEQHSLPFRRGLTEKRLNGHIARIAEGGYLGLPEGGQGAEMRVVDVYRREGAKLAENWVFIDHPHYLATQGLDVLQRMQDLNRSSQDSSSGIGPGDGGTAAARL